ncbi:uncharacterized protein FTOL_09222 [Fusarium torulosum]|uniref:Uncharacterized protein n=1 Tax=Fusarium torulosum TaxID=33205 RepID=A0AAE8SL70_9HYPO|nr:uncharacterized protein FTOL_09222 [Fusarium torulosum]
MGLGRLIVFMGVSNTIPHHGHMHKLVLKRLDHEFGTPRSWRGVKKRKRKFLFAVWGYGDYGDICLYGVTQYYFVVFVKDAETVEEDHTDLLAAVKDASGWQDAEFQCSWTGMKPLVREHVSEWLYPGKDRKGPRPQVGQLADIQKLVDAQASHGGCSR